MPCRTVTTWYAVWVGKDTYCGTYQDFEFLLPRFDFFLGDGVIESFQNRVGAGMCADFCAFAMEKAQLRVRHHQLRYRRNLAAAGDFPGNFAA